MPSRADSKDVSSFERQQEVRPLPGQLDELLLLNDNNPELITGEGILLSTFPTNQGLNLAFDGRFDLFSHHVYAGKPEELASTLWLAVLAQPVGTEPVTLDVIGGSTSLSQGTKPGQTAAPFLPLPSLMAETTTPIASGPGSRVAGDLLRGDQAPELPKQIKIAPGDASALLVLPIPVAGLDPLLNGRNLQLRLKSSAPVYLATVAAYGNNDSPPSNQRWRSVAQRRDAQPKRASAHATGQQGSDDLLEGERRPDRQHLDGHLADPGSNALNINEAPISWPISSLERGDLGTAQVQTAELKTFDKGTAWAAHGNYGVEYDLTLPLHNPDRSTRTVALALESPDKRGSSNGKLQFKPGNSGPVMFRGPIEVTGLDGANGRAMGRRRFHLVLRRGQQGPQLGTVSLAPGESRKVRVRLVYPADATPPQVLTVLPVKQSNSSTDVHP